MVGGTLRHESYSFESQPAASLCRQTFYDEVHSHATQEGQSLQDTPALLLIIRCI